VKDFPRDKQTRLLELLGEEQAIFERLRELTGEQTDILAADDVEALDESLDRRQELIEKINGLHQESDVLMQSYITFSESADGGKVTAIETAAEQLRGVIAECVELNGSNLTLAKETAKEYVKRIDELSVGKKSVGAYAQNVPNSSELFDKKT